MMDLIDRIIDGPRLYLGDAASRKAMIGKRIAFIEHHQIDRHRGMVFGCKQGIVESAKYSKIFIEDYQDGFDTRDFAYCIEVKTD